MNSKYLNHGHTPTMDYCQAEKEGSVGPLVPWTVVGRPVDGRRTVGGRSSVARVVNGAEKKII